MPRRREGANGQEVKSKDFTRERNMVPGGRERGREEEKGPGRRKTEGRHAQTHREKYSGFSPLPGPKSAFRPLADLIKKPVDEGP